MKFHKLLKANGVAEDYVIEEAKPPGPWEDVLQTVPDKEEPPVLNSQNSGSSLSSIKQSDMIVKSGQQNWKLDSYCRAIYSEDGEEYEAKIIEIDEDGSTVIIRFLGKKEL